MERVPMTVAGVEKLRTELEQLKNKKRPRVIRAIAEARAHGDLKENAEYHAAREQQGFIEGRIREIEAKLSVASIIDVTKVNTDGKVVFGASVTLFDEDEEQEISFRIVGEDEADLSEGLLSYASPIARAVIGKSEGEIAEVETPDGKRSYEITAIQYV